MAKLVVKQSVKAHGSLVGSQTVQCFCTSMSKSSKTIVQWLRSLLASRFLFLNTSSPVFPWCCVQGIYNHYSIVNETISHLFLLHPIQYCCGYMPKAPATTVEPALRDHCPERPPVLKDHQVSAESPTFQCKWNCHQRPPVLGDHIFIANWAVFQDRFYCITPLLMRLFRIKIYFSLHAIQCFCGYLSKHQKQLCRNNYD